MDLARPSIELQKRGRTTPQRLLPEARHKVIDFILSHEASESIIAVREPMEESILTPTF